MAKCTGTCLEFICKYYGIMYKGFFILEFGNGGGLEINSPWSQGTMVNPLHEKVGPPCYVSSVHGISQARILGLVAVSSSRGSSQPRKYASLMSVALGGGFFTTSITWEAHGQRRLVGYHPQSCKESDMTEVTNTFTHFVTFLPSQPHKLGLNLPGSRGWVTSGCKFW